MLALHLLEPVTMSQQLEVLPRPEQQDGDQKEPDPAVRLHLPVPLADRLHERWGCYGWPYDGVFERVPPARFMCASLKPPRSTRSFALRAPGLPHFCHRHHRPLQRES